MAFNWDSLPPELQFMVIELLQDFVTYNNLAQVSKAAYDTLTLSMGRRVVSRFAEEDVRRLLSPTAVLKCLRRIRLDAPIVYGIHMRQLIETYAFEHLCGEHLKECHLLLGELMEWRGNELSNQILIVNSTQRSFLDIFQTNHPLMATRNLNDTWSSTLRQRLPRGYRSLVWHFVGPLGYDMSQIIDRRSRHLPWSMTHRRILASQMAALFTDSRMSFQEEMYLLEAYLRFLSLVEDPSIYFGSTANPNLYRLNFRTLTLEQLRKFWNCLGSFRGLLTVQCNDFYADQVRPWIDSWDTFDKEEYVATCEVLRILSREEHKIYDSAYDAKIVDRLHELWVMWKDNRFLMSKSSARHRCFHIAWFVADRHAAVLGNVKDAILIAKRVVELEEEYNADHFPQSTLLLYARCKLSGYYIVAERVDEAMYEMHMLRLDVWKRLFDKSRISEALQWFRMMANANLWFQNDWCRGALEKHKRSFEADFKRVDKDRQALEVRVELERLPDLVTPPFQAFPMFEMAEVWARRQRGNVMMWELSWCSVRVWLLRSPREARARWQWLRSKHRLGFQEQHYIDLLYKNYVGPVQEGV
ncbi:hypothetical protein BKA64DRAFT_723231 [Cadophora sp. MPI-SDFR-AT-0126]|nr:hypothetical protein BKA64DRAFT_723231 [Leotiomycetes sp. MPI-SDFR-AT-0126]